MNSMTKKQVTKSLHNAATALEVRGPHTPRAIFRVGSKPNQAEVMRHMREFLETYAKAGNDLMEGRHPVEHVKQLQNLSKRICTDMDDLISAVEELYL